MRRACEVHDRRYTAAHELGYRVSFCSMVTTASTAQYMQFVDSFPAEEHMPALFQVRRSLTLGRAENTEGEVDG